MWILACEITYPVDYSRHFNVAPIVGHRFAVGCFGDHYLLQGTVVHNPDP